MFLSIILFRKLSKKTVKITLAATSQSAGRRLKIHKIDDYSVNSRQPANPHLRSRNKRIFVTYSSGFNTFSVLICLSLLLTITTFFPLTVQCAAFIPPWYQTSDPLAMPQCEYLDEVNPQGVFLRPQRGKSVHLFMKNKSTKCGKSQTEWINMWAGKWISPQMIPRRDSDRRASCFHLDFSAHDCCFGPSEAQWRRYHTAGVNIHTAREWMYTWEFYRLDPDVLDTSVA